MRFIWGRAGAIAQKEIYHVLRDPFTLALSIGLPIFMVIVFGIAIEFNVRNIPLAVYDGDNTQISRELVDIFGKSDYFIVHKVAGPKEALQKIMGNDDRAALIIPGGFQKDLFSGRVADAQILLDGSDSSTVVPILGYIKSIQQMAASQLADFKPPQNVNVKTRFLFNSELNSRWFVIPGLIVIIMALLSILLTALTVAQEWENGSMELLLSTPAEPLEIIVGKLVPYTVLSLGAVVFVYVISRTVFAVPFRGNLLVFGSGCVLFLLTYLAQGVLISVLTRTQHVAMQFAMLTGLLPVQLLSGFIFPIESMPVFFRYFTMILPARWFMVIARESYLKGSTFLELGIPFLALGITSYLMLFLATKKFKRDLEP